MITYDLTGQQFDRLLVIRQVPSTGKVKLKLWECLCVCGKRLTASTARLRYGAVKSCGCLRRELQRTLHLRHGHAPRGNPSRTYASWRSMLVRCYERSQISYLAYGAKGITVCDRWKSFDNFLLDMGERPEGKSLDRFPDSAGNYEPTNCRWATPKEQAANRKTRSVATHCTKGHAFTPENTVMRSGRRQCRSCYWNNYQKKRDALGLAKTVRGCTRLGRHKKRLPAVIEAQILRAIQCRLEELETA